MRSTISALMNRRSGFALRVHRHSNEELLLGVATLCAAVAPLFAAFGEGLYDSQIARELPNGFTPSVSEGRSDEQIKAVFIAQYGKRILALPEGPNQAGCS